MTERRVKGTEDRKQGGTGETGRLQKLWLAALFALLCLQVLILLYFGDRKAGFHEDEYYSYYSTNRTAGLFEPDREWVERDAFRNEFVVLKGERFRYGLVSTVQSWDVHPPFFYWLLHTACSLFPGVFSKWLGIGVNLVAFVINFWLLVWLAGMVSGKKRWLPLVAAAVYGCNGVIISGVMFIRMYEWLTTFVLLCACLHVRAVRKKDRGVKAFLLPLMAVNYLGFLTQYYYIIFLFFMAAGFCFWCLWQDRNIWNCIKYGFACGLSLFLAVLSYPASLSHIFRGYRGTGAAAEFMDVGNTGDRLGFFAGLMNEYLFDGYLWLWAVLLVVLAGVLMVRRRKAEGILSGSEIPGFLLLFAACGYFFTVSKTALLLYETSNRYQLPIYGILLVLVIAAADGLWSRILGTVPGMDARKKKWLQTAGTAAIFLLFLAGDIHGLASGKVIFLYEESAADVEYAAENERTPAVVLYNEATPYHVWWCAQELMQYEKVYFASQGNPEPITDALICGSGKVIVYAADGDAREESLQRMMDGNENLVGCRVVSRKGLWTVYELYG